MIPRRIFWFFDGLVLFASFTVVYLSGVQVLGWGIRHTPAAILERIPIVNQPVVVPTWTFPPVTDLLWTIPVFGGGVIVMLTLTDNYQSLITMSYTRIVVGAALSVLVGLSVVALVFFAFRTNDANRFFLFSFAAATGIGLAVYRIILRNYYFRRLAGGYYAKNVVLVGLTPAVEWMAKFFNDRLQSEYRIFGYLTVSEFQPPAEYHGSPIANLGKVDDLGSLLISKPIHEVIAVQPVSGGDWIEPVIQASDYLGVALRIVPEALLLGERRSLRTIYHSEPLNLPAVVMTPRNFNSEALFFKRVFDIVLSGTALVLLSPLFLVIAILIKLTTPKLPVFYPWRVVGQNGVRFTGYKFTTMVADADDRKQDLMQQNEMSGPVFKIKNDPRVTKVGKVLRKFDLNELPQLWSVFKGHMSLVGPRPAGPHELERYEFWHKRKLSIRPGITCLWQVRGRNQISNFDDWVRMDLEYIDNWSLWLDFKILIRTAGVVLSGTGS